jgi:hypothetical protein
LDAVLQYRLVEDSSQEEDQMLWVADQSLALEEEAFNY